MPIPLLSLPPRSIRRRFSAAPDVNAIVSALDSWIIPRLNSGRVESRQASAPAVAAGAQAGGAPPAPTVPAGATDVRGSVNFGSGTTPAAGAYAVVTYATAYPTAPNVVLTARNAATAGLQPHVINETATGFTVALGTAAAASQAVGTYSVSYHVAG